MCGGDLKSIYNGFLIEKFGKTGLLLTAIENFQGLFDKATTVFIASFVHKGKYQNTYHPLKIKMKEK